jgi:hypothetical protein
MRRGPRSWRLDLLSDERPFVIMRNRQLVLTEEDVYANESNGCLLRWEVGRSGYGPGDGYDELAHGHAGGSHEEEVATSHLLYEIEARES